MNGIFLKEKKNHRKLHVREVILLKMNAYKKAIGVVNTGSQQRSSFISFFFCNDGCSPIFDVKLSATVIIFHADSVRFGLNQTLISLDAEKTNFDKPCAITKKKEITF